MPLREVIKTLKKFIKQVYHEHVVKICSHEKCKCANVKMKIKKITHVVLEMHDCRVRFSIYVQFCHSAIFRKVFLQKQRCYMFCWDASNRQRHTLCNFIR